MTDKSPLCGRCGLRRDNARHVAGTIDYEHPFVEPTTQASGERCGYAVDGSVCGFPREHPYHSEESAPDFTASLFRHRFVPASDEAKEVVEPYGRCEHCGANYHSKTSSCPGSPHAKPSAERAEVGAKVAYQGIADTKALIENAKLFVETRSEPSIIVGMVRDLIRLVHQYEAERDEKQMALDGPIHTATPPSDAKGLLEQARMLLPAAIGRAKEAHSLDEANLRRLLAEIEEELR